MFASISALRTSSFLSLGLDADVLPGHGVSCIHAQFVELKPKVALPWLLGGQLCPKPMSSCLVADFPQRQWIWDV